MGRIAPDRISVAGLGNIYPSSTVDAAAPPAGIDTASSAAPPALLAPSSLTCLRPLCDEPAAPGWRQLCEPHLEQQLDFEREWRPTEDDR